MSLRLSFEPSDVERNRILCWLSEHDTTCSVMDRKAAIGGRLTFSFTPTTIGTVVSVACACGEKYDATEYEAW